MLVKTLSVFAAAITIVAAAPQAGTTGSPSCVCDMGSYEKCSDEWKASMEECMTCARFLRDPLADCTSSSSTANGTEATGVMTIETVPNPTGTGFMTIQTVPNPTGTGGIVPQDVGNTVFTNPLRTSTATGVYFPTGSAIVFPTGSAVSQGMPSAIGNVTEGASCSECTNMNSLTKCSPAWRNAVEKCRTSGCLYFAEDPASQCAVISTSTSAPVVSATGTAPAATSTAATTCKPCDAANAQVLCSEEYKTMMSTCLASGCAPSYLVDPIEACNSGDPYGIPVLPGLSK